MAAKAQGDLQTLPNGSTMTNEQSGLGLARYYFETKPTAVGSFVAAGVRHKNHGHYLCQLKVLLKRFLSPLTRSKNEPQTVPSVDANPGGWEPCEWVDFDTLTEDLMRFGVVSD
jgi:hypothetical protein